MATSNEKLKSLPTTPGVYLHKSATGEIIYVGKAANLRNRVRQYTHKSRAYDPKTELLVSEITDTDWIEVETEADALFLEAELVRRYMPRYNILLRDDKSLQFIRIDYKSSHPTVTMVRRPLDDGAEYFGPYLSAVPIRKALRCLRRAFPFSIQKPVGNKRASLHYHLGLDPGLEGGKTSLEDYRANLRKLMQYLRGERVALSRQIERDMKAAAKNKDYETAARLRNQLFALKELNRQILFSDSERLDISKDHALRDLCQLLALDSPPRRIEGYDISHMQGSNNAASMVVFKNGIPDKASYRKFKMRLGGNDDFAHIHETICRRLREENVKKWGTADLMLIDGGKGQLSSALAAREKQSSSIPTIGLAKREEEIIIHKTLSLPAVDLAKVKEAAIEQGAFINEEGDYLSIMLPTTSNLTKLLQRVRDESHRFAVSYHSTLARRRQTASILDEIAGIGPITRKKLIRRFGSLRGIIAASETEIGEVIGSAKAKTLKKYLEPAVRDV